MSASYCKTFNQKLYVMKSSIRIFAIMFLATVIFAFTESRIITGRVQDYRGTPLAGVSVSVKGSATRTITDLGGNYRISADPWSVMLLSNGR
jgi:hypothetical protein